MPHLPEVLATLCKVTTMEIIIIGVMASEDAWLAVEYGADAITLSDHGGRQLHCVPSTLEALPAITEAVEGRLLVFFDGGVRRGSDVFKAIALGADQVLIGRPVVWGLGYKGQKGVETIFNILEREPSRTTALAEVWRIADMKGTSLAAVQNTVGISRL